MIKISIRILIIVLFSLKIIFASSVFSLNSIGDNGIKFGDYSSGTGYTGLAVLDKHNHHHQNLSLTANLEQTRIYASFVGDFIYLKNQSNEELHSNYGFPSFQLAIPIREIFCIGLEYNAQYQNGIGYQVKTFYPELDSAEQVKTISKQGSINYLSIFLSQEIKKRFFYGMAAKIYFGTNEYSESLDYSNGYFQDNLLEDTEKFSGLGFNFSFTGKLTQNLFVGGYFNPKMQLKQKNKFTFWGKERQAGEVTHKLGNRLGLGVSYKILKLYRVNMDLNYSQFEKDNATNTDKNNDEYIMGIGFEKTSREEYLANFIERTSFRLGYYYRQTGIKISGTDIIENCFTAGVTAPLKSYNHALLFSFQLGTRGNASDVGFEETFYRFSVGFSGLEKWVKRRGYYQ